MLENSFDQLKLDTAGIQLLSLFQATDVAWWSNVPVAGECFSKAIFSPPSWKWKMRRCKRVRAWQPCSVWRKLFIVVIANFVWCDGRAHGPEAGPNNADLNTLSTHIAVGLIQIVVWASVSCQHQTEACYRCCCCDGKWLWRRRRNNSRACAKLIEWCLYIDIIYALRTMWK